MICNDEGSVVAKCTMRDVSASGASLVLHPISEVPDRFSLVLSQDGKVRRYCEVVWRSQALLGVRFVSAPASAAHAPGVHAVAGGTP